MVSGIIGVAGVFGWLLSYLNFNDIVLAGITGVTGTKLGVMLLMTAVMLVLTMFVDSMAILIIMIPVAVVVGRNFGIDEFQLGLHDGDGDADRLDDAAGGRAPVRRDQHRRLQVQ